MVTSRPISCWNPGPPLALEPATPETRLDDFENVWLDSRRWLIMLALRLLWGLTPSLIFLGSPRPSLLVIMTQWIIIGSRPIKWPISLVDTRNQLDLIGTHLVLTNSRISTNRSRKISLGSAWTPRPLVKRSVLVASSVSCSPRVATIPLIEWSTAASKLNTCCRRSRHTFTGTRPLFAELRTTL
ncbi:hypothetical protein PCANC_12814 [Puccinia coronata f. sp. avenae]|uniref:Uncharacterized protein n=1 Tax=Puccinia coronata f. sp. avenae TaxID=200324 RepID=A0A2N5T0D7_9BASI|nr:hypothetical protein PCANC_12814 [Puccinia coronata f. sp. avenae]